ncbi:GAF sensor signal transduction histidine kinase [Ekhidna lutea]|uniref:histidine kinase n=1 Tax=Ekhidna lutea TaxID=447679 RepID=A0A239GNJ8_EKHLU|nr:GAF domain-containing sensor histidine kinase [Ekhidna lutea]SNS70445.1 GAF sensor signal transduction histidine kinase [Ekhidna lutea]
MIEPSVPEQEEERLNELDALQILDTLPEKDYDNLTKIASTICGTKISLVSLVDSKRQWFKSKHGLEVPETPRELAFCAHAINTPNEPLIINDAREDDRFHDNPLVTGYPNVIFYAGMPLVTDNSQALGTLCVIDSEPKELSEDQLEALNALAKQIVNLFELRKKRMELERSIRSLEINNLELQRFAGMVAHDIKQPVSIINGLIEFLKESDDNGWSEESKVVLEKIENSSDKLIYYIEGLLKYTKEVHLENLKKEYIPVSEIKGYVNDLFSVEHVSFSFTSNVESVNANRIVAERVILNLVTNAIKYVGKKQIEIDLDINEKDNVYTISISDNGPGIDESDRERIFELFNVLDPTNKDSTGMGLAVVKKLVIGEGGDIWVDTADKGGAKFSFTLPK